MTSTSSDLFKAWFGASAIQDDEGAPLQVFHGTATARGETPFEVFEQRHDGRFDVYLPAGEKRAGFYFSPRREDAEGYARGAAMPNKVPRIVEAFLSIQNPYFAREEEFGFYVTQADVERLQAIGHDGVVKLSSWSEGKISKAFQIVAFRPDQVVMAESLRGFDPTSPDIRMSQAREEDAHLISEAEFGRRRQVETIQYFEQKLARARAGELDTGPFSEFRSKAAAVRGLTARLADVKAQAPEKHASDHLAQINRAMEEGLMPSAENIRRYDIPVPKDLQEQVHGRALEETGFWGHAAAGCVFMARSTGRIMLSHRSKHVLEPHTWGTWGGAIDVTEDPKEAVRREALEEAGVRQPLQLVPLLVFQSSRFRYSNFLAIVEEEFDPELNWETQGAQWTALDALPEPLHPGVQALMAHGPSVETLHAFANAARAAREQPQHQLTEATLNGEARLPGLVRADVVATRGQVASIYGWSSPLPGHGNTRIALAALREYVGAEGAIVVHDPGEPGTDAFNYWRKMLGEGLITQVLDAEDQDITDSMRDDGVRLRDVTSESVAYSSLPPDMQDIVAQYLEMAGWEIPAMLPTRVIPLSAFPDMELADGYTDERGEAYAAEMIGQKVPPIVVAGNTWLDGRHRVWAARKEGRLGMVAIDLGADLMQALPRNASTMGALLRPEPNTAFERWFQGSAVVTTNGEPLVLYHGTNADFTQVLADASREDGSFFCSPDPKVASDFALFRTTWGGANVMPVYAAARRVLEIEGAGRNIRDVEETAQIDGMRYGETLRDYARREGYNGVRFKDVRDGAGPDIAPVADIYAFFESASIKSALGNRGTFDPDAADIRFSLRRAERDAADFPGWIAQSVVMDGQQPRVVYHGTRRDFDEFDLSPQRGLGLHLGTASQASRRLEDLGGDGAGNRVIPVYLALKRPLRLPDMGTWTSDRVIEGLEDAAADGAIDAAFVQALADQLESIPAEPARIEAIRAQLRGLGFDGIVYANTGEETLDFGEEAGDDSYIVFDAHQVRPALAIAANELAAAATTTTTVVQAPPHRDWSTDPAFKQWFGKSKVVDADRKPIVVYHGATHAFDEFIPSGEGFYGSGIYFTPDYKSALEYAEQKDVGTPTVVAAYLYMERPYVFNAPPAEDEPTNVALARKLLTKRGFAQFMEYVNNVSWYNPQNEFEDRLTQLGYDGLIVKLSRGETEYIVFDPSQVKSVDNAGTFDPNSNDIRERAQDARARDTSTEEGETTMYATMESMRTAIARTINVPAEKLREDIGALMVVTSDALRQEWVPSGSEAALGRYSSDPTYVRMLEQRSQLVAAELDRIGYRADAQCYRHATSQRWMVIVPPEGSGPECRVFFVDGNGVHAPEVMPSKEVARSFASSHDFSVPDFTAVERLKLDPSFRMGLFIGGLSHQVREGKISFLQAHHREQAYRNLDAIMDYVRRNRMQAFHDPGTGSTIFIADRIPAGQEVPVFLHEIVHRHGRQTLGPQSYASLVDRVKAFEKCEPGSVEELIFRKADAESAKYRSRPEAYNDELFAHAVEFAVRAGVTPRAEAAAATAEGWLSAVVASLRDVAQKLVGNDLDDLTAQDLVDLAYALAQLDNPKRAEKIKEALGSTLDELIERVRQEEQRPEAARPEAILSEHPPFMMTEGGKDLRVFNGDTGEPLPDDWTGVCTSPDTPGVKFWYIGREDGERSFNVLKATDYLTALAEAQNNLLKPPQELQRDSAPAP